MKTTDASEEHRSLSGGAPRPAGLAGGHVLRGAAAATLAAGLALGVLGAATSGSAAAWGALVGAVIAAAVMSLGTFPMNLVAQVMPTLSLAFALLTYAFQLMMLIAALVALDRAGLVGEQLSRPWLGAAIMLGVGCWVVAHVVLAARARIPVYDLGPTAPSSDAGGSADPTTDPGAR